MTTYTRNEYARLRIKHPDMPARHVLTWARARMPHALDWDESSGGSVGTATIEGWDVEARITDDDDVDASETYGTLTMRHERGAFANPYWREWHKDNDLASYWHGDTCGSRHDDDGAAQWYVPPDGQTLDELRSYYHKQGASRHAAYTRALAELRAMASDCQTAVADRYGQGRYAFAYVVATVSLAGVEVASAAYGGYAWEREYSKPLDPQLDAIVDDAVREALAEAPLAVERAAQAEEARASALASRASALRSAYVAIAS